MYEAVSGLEEDVLTLMMYTLGGGRGRCVAFLLRFATETSRGTIGAAEKCVSLCSMLVTNLDRGAALLSASDASVSVYQVFPTAALTLTEAPHQGGYEVGFGY